METLENYRVDVDRDVDRDFDNRLYKDPDEFDSDDSYSFTEYDITSSPNDFNIKTIFDFMESGSLVIPGFQRNYVWDIKRASKLIESIITAACQPFFQRRQFLQEPIDYEKVNRLENDERFINACRVSTTNSSNVNERLDIARSILYSEN